MNRTRIWIGLVAMLLMVGLAACTGGTQQDAAEPMLIDPELFRAPVGEPAVPLPDFGTLSEVPTEMNSTNDQVLALINEQRAQQGCPPLTRNAVLDAVAYTHSEDMANNDFVSHNSRDGTEFWQRIQNAGYPFAEAAENIAAGSTTPEQTVQLWMASAGHSKNILNCNLRETGIGIYHNPKDSGEIVMFFYWTQVFAIPQ